MEQVRFVNETGAEGGTLSCLEPCGLGPAWQPPAKKLHRPGHMSLIRVSMALLTATFTLSVVAQSPAAAADSVPVSSTLRPALAQVGQALGGISVKRWKAPNEVKSAADQDATSIQRDLNGTLANLLQQADAAPGSVPAAFAVYRNVDALYDTLLRVVLTANLAAPDNEVNALQGALSSLESARGSLGDSILNASQAQQTELVRVRTALARAAAAPPPATKTTVVDDGPAESARKKKPPTKKSSSSKPSTSTPQ
jgi:hypothetical protein